MVLVCLSQSVNERELLIDLGACQPLTGPRVNLIQGQPPFHCISRRLKQLCSLNAAVELACPHLKSARRMNLVQVLKGCPSLFTALGGQGGVAPDTVLQSVLILRRREEVDGVVHPPDLGIQHPVHNAGRQIPFDLVQRVPLVVDHTDVCVCVGHWLVVPFVVVYARVHQCLPFLGVHVLVLGAREHLQPDHLLAQGVVHDNFQENDAVVVQRLAQLRINELAGLLGARVHVQDGDGGLLGLLDERPHIFADLLEHHLPILQDV
mmetsp:Transcript_67453/g.112982  ORF Transcript_67453/g.112982 Transcript_67453/m.112982 type:complete len:264 (+) Transcript_67453:997-1788(+)